MFEYGDLSINPLETENVPYDFFGPIEWHDVSDKTPQVPNAATGADISYKDLHNTGIVVSFLPGTVNVNAHDYIQIFSTLQSPYWRSDGSRSQLIERVNLGVIGSQPTIVTQPTRVYQVKDWESSIRCF